MDFPFAKIILLGKFSVIMADPPWDIHMELPYGTLSEDEMRQLSIPILQDEGLIFLWVTGRAMELGREVWLYSADKFETASPGSYVLISVPSAMGLRKGR